MEQKIEALDLGFWGQFLVIGTVASFLIGLILLGLLVHLIEHKSSKKIRISVLISGLTCIALTVIGYNMVDMYNAKKVALAEEILSKAETKQAVIQDITELTIVNDELCAELSKDEDCYYITFIGDTKQKQAFTPIKKEFDGEINKGLILTYIDLPDKEMIFSATNAITPVGLNSFYAPVEEEILDYLYGIKLEKE